MKDYDDFVAEGFYLLVDAVGTFLNLLCAICYYTLGWPLALLGWFTQRRKP